MPIASTNTASTIAGMDQAIADRWQAKYKDDGVQGRGPEIQSWIWLCCLIWQTSDASGASSSQIGLLRVSHIGLVLATSFSNLPACNHAADIPRMFEGAMCGAAEAPLFSRQPGSQSAAHPEQLQASSPGQAGTPDHCSGRCHRRSPRTSGREVHAAGHQCDPLPVH